MYSCETVIVIKFGIVWIDYTANAVVNRGCPRVQETAAADAAMFVTGP